MSGVEVTLTSPTMARIRYRVTDRHGDLRFRRSSAHTGKSTQPALTPHQRTRSAPAKITRHGATGIGGSKKLIILRVETEIVLGEKFGRLATTEQSTHIRWTDRGMKLGHRLRILPTTGHMWSVRTTGARSHSHPRRNRTLPRCPETRT